MSPPLPPGRPGAGATGAAPGPDSAADRLARRILEGFEDYHARFLGITRRSRRLFEGREWRGVQVAAAERLALYRLRVDGVVEAARESLAGREGDPELWSGAKRAFARLTAGRDDGDVARTFFNSVSRRVLHTVGVRAGAEFLGEETGAPPPAEGAEGPAPELALRVYPASPLAGVLERILAEAGLHAPFRDRARDARLAAAAVAAGIARSPEAGPAHAMEVVPALFFRNKGAYLVARLRRERGLTPLILPLLNGERGVSVDAVLMHPDEASIVFGFSWSYFHVDVARPRALVAFLRSFMPHKRPDELYTTLGYNRHGKTLLYQSLRWHLQRPGARFEPAEGTPGMVMSVFTLPSLNVVFKVIKDRFAPPKRISRRTVQERYRLVFFRDRVGRLADAQEFESLELRSEHFSPAVLGELLEEAPRTVRVDGERVVIDHLYTERRLTPLDLYLRREMAAGAVEAARAALLDYGRAVKDLAAANIFPGDMLIKNFGVTRHGRVVFYDYDELSLLTECVFRDIPAPVHPEDELAEEPWFYVGERDVFPEEFLAFLAIPEPLKGGFLRAHADLFENAFWLRMQERARSGELVDFFPYPPESRLDPPRLTRA